MPQGRSVRNKTHGKSDGQRCLCQCLRFESRSIRRTHSPRERRRAAAAEILSANIAGRLLWSIFAAGWPLSTTTMSSVLDWVGWDGMGCWRDQQRAGITNRQQQSVADVSPFRSSSGTKPESSRHVEYHTACWGGMTPIGSHMHYPFVYTGVSLLAHTMAMYRTVLCCGCNRAADV